MVTEPAGGWRADPDGTNQLRWQDGHAQTNYIEPHGAPAPSPKGVEAAVPAVDEAFLVSSPEKQAVTSADTPIPMPEASLPQGVTPTSLVVEAPVAPIPMPGSPVDEKNNNKTDTPEKSGALKWVLTCATSWVLVAMLITMLVIIWSHLGASGHIQEDAKNCVETTQSGLDAARSTLESISQQLQEATK